MSGLAIKIGGDVSGFDRAMSAASSLAVKSTTSIATSFLRTSARIDAEFAKTGERIGLSLAKGIGNGLKPMAIGAGALVTGAAVLALGYAAVSTSISQANDQIEKFLKLGENSERSGVGVEFFQRFSEAAEKAKLSVEEIEAALKHAGQAVMPKFEQADPIKSRLNEVFESGYTGSYQSKGLDDYRSANTNEQRIRAAVTAMQELRDVVGMTAAVDLAGKLFGAETADRIRSGRLDIDAIAESLDRKRDDLITQAQVQQAQDFRERLSEAYGEIDKALGVSVNLAAAGQDILNVWLATVQTVAAMTTAMDPLIAKIGEAKKASEDMMGALASALGAQAVNRYLFPNQGKEIYSASDPATTPVPIAPPQPPRRPLEFFTDKPAPKVKAAKTPTTPTETLDQVQTAINGIERSTEALKAEADAIGKTATERQTAINVARIEAIARQQGITLTAEQIAKVKDLSKATVEYRDAIEDAREKQEAFRSIGGDVLKGIASDARNGASALDILTNAVSRLAERLQDKALDSLADSLFGKSGGSGGSGLLGGLLGGTGGIGGIGESVKGLNLASLFGASPLPKFAAGVSALGVIDGPGTGTSDSILARVSKGESIVKASATARHRPLIEAMNADRLPALASGGMIARAGSYAPSSPLRGFDQAVSQAHTASGESAGGINMPVSVTNTGTPQEVRSAQVVTDGNGQRRLEMTMGDIVAAGSKTPQAKAAARTGGIVRR